MRMRTILASLWLGTVIGLVLLGKAAATGPIAWFETWFAVRTGQLLGASILFVMLMLALPSIWILFGVVGRASKAGPTPASLQRHFRIAAILLFVLAFGFLLMAVLAGAQMARLPGGSEPAAKLAPDGLEAAAAAARRVALTGAPIDDARATFIQPGKQSSTRWVYVGFRPGARRSALAAIPDRAAIALFIEQRENEVAPDQRYVPPEQDEFAGYLIENGLPDHARIVLERRGVAIAAPHYLLRVDENGPRGPYYLPLFLGLFFAFVFGLVGLGLALKGSAWTRSPA